MIDLDLLDAVHRAGRLDEFMAQLTGPERMEVEEILLGRMARWDPLHGTRWEDWNRIIAPAYFSGPYAAHHRAFWEWVEQIGPERPDPHLNIWPRGHAKSTSVEMATVRLGALGIRRYCLYVSATQDQADDHVMNIGAILEGQAMEVHYPAMAAKRVGKHGNSRGWRRNRLWTASGFVVDALGLDTAARGAKLEAQRPDVLALDDIDETHATDRAVAKKLRTIAQDLMPAVTPNAVVMMAQNYVAPNAIAVKIGRRDTDILAGSIVSGPYPAVDGLELELVEGRWRIVAGRPTWDGMDLAKAEAQIQLMGLVAYTIECQQDVAERPGSLWGTTDGKAPINRIDPADVPELERVVVAVDPNKTGRSDDAGVVVVGLGWPYRDSDGHPVGLPAAYVLADGSGLARPSEWRDTAVRLAIDHHAGSFVVESAGLGEHARLTIEGSPLYENLALALPVYDADATLGKLDRARPVAQLYKDHRVFHVGSFPYMESQMTGWEPDHQSISPGGVDAVVHAITHLMIERSGGGRVAVSTW